MQTAIDVDQLETRVKKALTDLSLDWSSNRGDRTRKVKNAVGRVAKESGFKWAAAGCDADVVDENAEWMWDGGAWIENDSGWTIRQPLILESEWDRSDAGVKDDFQKLVVSRADLRLMVFQRATEPEAKLTMSVLECGARLSLSEPGDRYLMACWCDDRKNFVFETFTVENSATI
jgi:hypothetical protein